MRFLNLGNKMGPGRLERDTLNRMYQQHCFNISYLRCGYLNVQLQRYTQ